MSYRLALDRHDSRDLASGHVLRSAPGYPAFPVRLAEEMFLRSRSHLPDRPLGMWDPCCGSGYLATVLGLRRRDQLRSVLCSDVDPAAVELAGRNLGLLSAGGLAQRREELERRFTEHGRPGYAEAAQAADRLANQLRAGGGDLTTRTAVADLFDPGQLAGVVGDEPPDLVVTDVPYGVQAHWGGALPAGADPLIGVVRGLSAVLPDESVIALCAQARKISLGGARALERFRIGNRTVLIGRTGELRSAIT